MPFLFYGSPAKQGSTTMTARQLRERRAELIKKAKGVMAQAETNEDQKPSEEQQAEFDKLMADAKDIEPRIADMEALETAEASITPEQNDTTTTAPAQTATAAPQTPRAKPGDTQTTTAPQATQTTPRIAAPRYKLRSFRFGANYQENEAAAHASGQWFKATNPRCGGYDEARQWCRNNGLEYRVMSEGTNTAGGYLVPDLLLNTIINLQDEFGVARRLCTVYPMASDSLRIPKRDSGPTATWVGEAAALTASTPALDAVQLSAKKLHTLVRVSSELFEDSAINLGDYLATDSASALTEAEDDALINGDGTSTYGGVYGLIGQFDANESLVGVHTAASSVDTFAEITNADLTGCMGVLPEYAYRGAGPNWLCSAAARQNTFNRLGLVAGGTSVVNIAGGIADGYGGYPIVMSSKMPAGIGTDYSENTMVCFGNFAQGCAFGDRRAITAQTLVELYAATDEVGIKVTTRVDIVFHEAGDTTNAGAVVALMGD